MNWKREMVEKLQQYALLEHAMRNIPEEIARLESQLHGLRSTTTSTVPTKGGGNRYEAHLINNLIQKQELHWSLEQAHRWLQLVDQGMAVLDPDEKLILERMYIYPEEGAAHRLCEDLDIEQSSLYRKRENALRKLTLAMYGKLES